MTVNGLMIGLVTDLDDPEKLGRVRLKFPQLSGPKPLSNWARVSAPMAGKERGFFFRPEVGDEVLVAFEQGDARRPYVIGGVWSKEDKPPPDDGQNTKNNWRFIRSRSGHLIKLDDTAGAELIEVVDKDGNCRVLLDAAKKKVKVVCDQGDIEVSTGSGNVKVHGTSVEMTADANISIKAGGTLELKGTTVNIN